MTFHAYAGSCFQPTPKNPKCLKRLQMLSWNFVSGTFLENSSFVEFLKREQFNRYLLFSVNLFIVLLSDWPKCLCTFRSIR